jgi:hypothetical protein
MIDHRDQDWLTETDVTKMEVKDFLLYCQDNANAAGWLKYDSKTQTEIMP